MGRGRGPRRQIDSRHDPEVVLVHNPIHEDYELVHHSWVCEPSPIHIIVSGKVQAQHVGAYDSFISSSSFEHHRHRVVVY